MIGLSAMQLFDQHQSWNLYENLPVYSPAKFDAYQYGINLDVVAFQITAARGFMNDKLSAGIGLALLRGDLVFNNLAFRRNPMPAPISDRPYEKIPEWYSADGNGWGFGYRAGLLYKLNDKINAAITYAGSSSFDISGTTDFKFYMGMDTSLQSNRNYSATSEQHLFVNGEVAELKADFSSNLHMPATLGGGLSCKVTEKLTVDLDAEMTFWSSFKGYNFTFSNFVGLKDTSFHNANDLFTANMSVPIEWKNATKVMFGADYKARSFLDLRAGVSYDQSPIKTETFIPQFIDLGNKLGLNIGAGLTFGLWKIELATSYTHQKDLNVTDMVIGNNGILENIPAFYRANNYQTVFGLTYRF